MNFYPLSNEEIEKITQDEWIVWKDQLIKREQVLNDVLKRIKIRKEKLRARQQIIQQVSDKKIRTKYKKELDLEMSKVVQEVTAKENEQRDERGEIAALLAAIDGMVKDEDEVTSDQ